MWCNVVKIEINSCEGCSLPGENVTNCPLNQNSFNPKLFFRVFVFCFFTSKYVTKITAWEESRWHFLSTVCCLFLWLSRSFMLHQTKLWEPKSLSATKLCWHAARAPLNSKPIIVSSGSAQTADRLTFLKAEVSQERHVAAGIAPLCSHIHVRRFCLTRLEPQQGAAATPRTLCCFAWYFELFNRGDWYSHWRRNSAYTPSNSELWQRLLAFTAHV